MKLIYFQISVHEAGEFFQVIRSKENVIEILLRTVRMMLIRPYSEKKLTDPYCITLCVDKMSRLFFIAPDKMFSIVLPFSVKIRSDNRLFFDMSGYGGVSNKIITHCLDALKLMGLQTHLDFMSMLSDQLHGDGGYEDGVGLYDYDSSDDVERIWMLIKELMMYEDGYFRCDDDPENEKSHGRDIHPRHHFDIFYTTRSTFKLGLSKRPEISTVLDMLRPERPCRFLQGI